MFPEVVETNRLRLERLSRQNLPVLELYDHAREGAPDIEEVTRYVSWDPHPHPQATREFLVSQEEAWDERRIAGYAVRLREGEREATSEETSGAEEPGAFAGTTGLTVDWDRRTGGLGLWLRKRFWGRGYSGERAFALAELAFERLDLDLLAVSHHADNENSRRAIERYVDAMGGRREGTRRNGIVDADGPVADEVRYSVSRAEWRESTDGGETASVEFVD